MNEFFKSNNWKIAVGAYLAKSAEANLTNTSAFLSAPRYLRRLSVFALCV
jgi:hypothetical protein